MRLLRTNLTEEEVGPRKEALAQAMFDHIPVGVGGRGLLDVTADDLEEVLRLGMDWSLRKVRERAGRCARERVSKEAGERAWLGERARRGCARGVE